MRNVLLRFFCFEASSLKWLMNSLIESYGTCSLSLGSDFLVFTTKIWLLVDGLSIESS